MVSLDPAKLEGRIIRMLQVPLFVLLCMAIGVVKIIQEGEFRVFLKDTIICCALVIAVPCLIVFLTTL